MHVFKEISEIRSARRQDPHRTWGLVPTMGFLHDGHLSLVRKARSQNDCVGVSIFVNPMQFNDARDLESYPRALDRDLLLLQDLQVDLVWVPDKELVYPEHFQTSVEVAEISRRLEGTSRPGHFRGVTTVVTKLFNVFQPHRAYFGQKDAQQVAVIKQMARDLDFDVDIITCPTIREPDGLALSSRNAHLSPDERQEAVCLYLALTAAATAYHKGQKDAGVLRRIMTETVETRARADIDYVSVAATDTLTELDEVGEDALLSLAVRIGKVRLIDNLLLEKTRGGT
jgi:pantoate--beta-alanine ligase